MNDTLHYLSAETIETILISAFGLSNTGQDADFYRLAERAAARDCAQWLALNPRATTADALATLGAEWLERAPRFYCCMRELALRQRKARHD